MEKKRLTKKESRKRLLEKISNSFEFWTKDEFGFRRRNYSKYEDYLLHQKDKLTWLSPENLVNHDCLFIENFLKRLKELDFLKWGATVLCLGARTGAEVRAFLNIGCFSVGIDINPGENNHYVMYGDFHSTAFPQISVDVVFTNSLDHVFDIDKVIKEIKRILKEGGYLIIEPTVGEEKKEPGFYESFWWKDVDSLISLFLKDFDLVQRSQIDFPGKGEQVILRKSVSEI